MTIRVKIKLDSDLDLEHMNGDQRLYHQVGWHLECVFILFLFILFFVGLGEVFVL